ncbi:hypothetical protein EYF80_032714 [Liparis tanakae]|uniref:Uncharacterized protein n=1 Tax=Liparis tanakae TaxID=230148 RepID=A0A4Z2GUE2_9TELE|nr:hypothetical protein EYF80_032714 [Liparis tanakae]
MAPKSPARTRRGERREAVSAPLTLRTAGLLSPPSTDTITPADRTSEMKCRDADEAMEWRKEEYLNMPETMSNPHILRH